MGKDKRSRPVVPVATITGIWATSQITTTSPTDIHHWFIARAIATLTGRSTRRRHFPDYLECAGEHDCAASTPPFVVRQCVELTPRITMQISESSWAGVSPVWTLTIDLVPMHSPWWQTAQDSPHRRHHTEFESAAADGPRWSSPSTKTWPRPPPWPTAPSP